VTNFEMQVLPALLGPVTMAVSAGSPLVMGSSTLERWLRDALSFCKAAELVPALGPHSVSQVVATLLDATGPLTTTTLADEAGILTVS
jgi:hypothetical protein